MIKANRYELGVCKSIEYKLECGTILYFIKTTSFSCLRPKALKWS